MVRIVDKKGVVLTEVVGGTLAGANLNGANLTGVELENAVGNGREIVSMQIPTYRVAFTREVLQIGCERHAIGDWRGFDDETISRMDPGALQWWNMWRGLIFQAIEKAFGEG